MEVSPTSAQRTLRTSKEAILSHSHLLLSALTTTRTAINNTSRITTHLQDGQMHWNGKHATSIQRSSRLTKKKAGTHHDHAAIPLPELGRPRTKPAREYKSFSIHSQEPGPQSWSRLIHLRFMTLSHRQRNSPPHKIQFPWKT